MVELPVTFWMSCQIFTSIFFPSLKNIQEDLPKSRKVEKFFEEEDDHFLLFRK